MLSYRFVFHYFGILCIALGMILLGVAGWSAIELARGQAAEKLALSALAVAALSSLALGGAVWRATRGPEGRLGRREAFLLVALSWLAGAVVCGVPYFVWAHLSVEGSHVFHGFIDCYFEAMSGLTTTGATVLTNIEAIPHSLLLWRALTHWLGGLGIIVMFVAVLPLLGAGGKKLFRVEAPGPTPEGVRPLIRETARYLWYIYMGLTVVETVALRIAGLSWFEAVCQTFATLATGGFSTNNASIGGFNSLGVDVIIMLFMILAGVNFGLYYRMIRGRPRDVLRDTELRVYLSILLVGSAIVIMSLIHAGTAVVATDGRTLSTTVGNAVRHGAFTAISVQTTTGFCTADFDRWPFLARGVCVALMFIGGSAGSTGGGLKVIRIIICFKVILAEIERAFRPRVIRPVKVSGVPIDQDLRLGTVAYVLGVIVLFLAGAGLIMALEPPEHNCTFITAATASVATLFNIGPGLSGVGAVENYAWFTDSSKLVLSLLMVIGRLEVFAIAVLFVPRFWRGD